MPVPATPTVKPSKVEVIIVFSENHSLEEFVVTILFYSSKGTNSTEEQQPEQLPMEYDAEHQRTNSIKEQYQRSALTQTAPNEGRLLAIF